MTTAAIYVRISSDATGEGLGVARQEADCRALADRLGWTVTEVYRDNDISAYSGKVRPDYERLLSNVEAGTVRGLIAWHPDRLHRSPKELERFIDLAERTGLQVQTCQSGAVDLTTPSGRMVARMLGATARYESEHKAARIRRKLAENAAAGKPHGGHRPYGWEPDRLTIRESEAAVIREAASRVLAGEPLRSIFRDLNARGLHNASGKPWTHPTFRNVLLHARHAGLREHNGQEMGVAAWPAIIPPETWRAVRRVLNNPDRVTTPGRAGRLHLLSGIAVCGVCGSPLRVGHSKSTEAYRCMASACVSRRRDRLEEYVEAVVIARLSRPDAAALLAPDDDGGERERAAQAAERVRQRLDDAAASFAAGVITARQLATITGQLRPELAALEAAAAPPPDRASVLGDLLSSDDVTGAWERLSPDARRTVVRLLMEIKVSRGRRGPGFSTDGIEISWR
ncbi:DNA invertase Pin-like site-specific DNA recombinase [Micromonospora palomenae]|uniref:DNA invertase Pin-like site-specific DNA recombinase n=1 Tax=Micromonospora palomenae TaxID=1461247 RepID=A0A561VPC1_9ACTN|nr:recombinase family protein [Micromonospora palomenae]TWG13460.1 DNA invertase Pin-like site-specific DNA recombinase [Micromonospora palomenae]